MHNETYVRMQIVNVGKKLAQRFFVASNDGNISAKLDDNTILITPTGINKGDVVADQILKVDLDGNLIEGHMKATSEIKMHLAAYRIRPDIKAIVHAHPPAATAFAITGEKIDQPMVLPEAMFSLGKIGYCRYGTPSTNEVPQSIEKEIACCDSLILSNHGAMTVGQDVMQAYYRMESLELVSRIVIASRILGNVKPLNDEQIRKLDVVRREHGWGNTAADSKDLGSSENKAACGNLVNIDVDKVTKIITDAIRGQN